MAEATWFKRKYVDKSKNAIDSLDQPSKPGLIGDSPSSLGPQKVTPASGKRDPMDVFLEQNPNYKRKKK
jgi:hypothetical protein